MPYHFSISVYSFFKLNYCLFALPYTIAASNFTLASPFFDAPLCAPAPPLTLASPCTLTSPSWLPSPDVLSVCIQTLPMKHFASCAIYLFPIPYRLTSLSKCSSTCSSTTHHYITAYDCHRLFCLYFPQHHTNFLMHSLLPHHGAVPDTAPYCSPTQRHSKNSESISQGQTSHYPSPHPRTMGLSPYHSLLIPSQYLCQFLPLHISIPVPAVWEKKYL